MRIIEIVEDTDYYKVKSVLQQLKSVKSEEVKTTVDEVTLLSQYSLAQEWDNEGDNESYEVLYKNSKFYKAKK
ncbi:hypothetical protein ACFSKU_08970 [Pontibacter silvestris]|uniref:Uncharacterized protein n=1 Tax=Pontibacter silvestris TaxID=2305183 RepID=A0ABW4WWA6_9BACT|nr:hypothetical protein [Pontibacter silvestris]MCC9138858.1 hypothetical protein [Pontibacter silvestris]